MKHLKRIFESKKDVNSIKDLFVDLTDTGYIKVEVYQRRLNEPIVNTSLNRMKGESNFYFNKLAVMITIKSKNPYQKVSIVDIEDNLEFSINYLTSIMNLKLEYISISQDNGIKERFHNLNDLKNVIQSLGNKKLIQIQYIELGFLY